MVTQPKVRRHILTINLEDYFQVGAFQRFVAPEQWQRYEPRLVEQTERTLDLLDRYQARATFFVLGRVAETHPDLIRKVAQRGHEIASRGYGFRDIRQLSPEEFRADLLRSRSSVEAITGNKVVGYRTADGWFRPSDLWALDILAEEGFLYDSSIGPVLRKFADQPWRRYTHDALTPHGPIKEFPVSSTRVLGCDLPIGGNWVRQIPRFITRNAAEHWEKKVDAPFVMYFHTWEIDPDQPRFGSMGLLTRIRHYRGLERMEEKISEFLQRFPFVSASEYLGLTPEALTALPVRPSTYEPKPVLTPSKRSPVSIAIPLYNEEPVIPFLANTLKEVRRSFAEQGYDPRFILVNDASKDRTHELIEREFGGCEDVKIVQHEKNRGVAAAISTGIANAETEIVCSMDADCTYDPHELLKMIPLLASDVDMVVASPYHPRGEVRNVPAWRLVLSKGASRLYRRIFHNKLQTYTSCFRVYRRSKVKDIPLRHGNFLGVVELFGLLDLKGSRIEEHPAILNVRLLGRSKMKTLRTIFGHLRLMARFAWKRFFARQLPHERNERDRALHLLMESAGTPCHRGLEEQQLAQKPVGIGS
jgi:polysaccharide deacetylase family protein (PEP-CTERM system associated)